MERTIGKDGKVYCPAIGKRIKPTLVKNKCEGKHCRFNNYCNYRAELKYIDTI